MVTFTGTNAAPTINITDDVAVGPVTSDTFAFTMADANPGDTLTASYAYTTGTTCTAGLSYTNGSSVTNSTKANNGSYLCARAYDGTVYTYQRSANVLNINNNPTITVTDDVAAGPVTSDTFAFTAGDVDSGDTPTTGYAFTSGACDNSLTFTAGNSVTVTDDTTNGQFLCAMADDGTAAVYQISADALNINHAPTITITDDVETGPVMSDTFAFTAADVDAGDTPTTGYAFTSGACDNSLTFTAGSSVTVTDDTTNGQFLCAMADDGTAAVYQISTNALNIDATQPTATISGLPATISGTTPVQFTVTFSEDVTGFDSADVTVSGASVTSVSGGPAVYTVTLTPAGDADVVVSIVADAAADAAGNLSLASGELTATNTLPAETSAMIANYMQARARNLVANQPGLLAIVRGGAHFDAQVTRGEGLFDLATDMSKPIWFQLRGNWSEAGTQRDRYVLGVIGTHIQPNENLWLGAMLQFDDALTEDGASRTSGQGWLVGPYFVAKHPTQALFFEGSLLYGQSQNEASPLGTFTDSFDTERFLATLKVTGEIEVDQATLYPSLGLIHVSDQQKAYTDGLGNPIAGQKITQTDLSMGLTFSTPLPVKQGSLTLTGGPTVHWSKTTGGTGDAYDGGSGRFDLGLTYLPNTNTTIRVGAYLDGIGNDGFEAYGASFDVGVRF